MYRKIIDFLEKWEGQQAPQTINSSGSKTGRKNLFHIRIWKKRIMKMWLTSILKRIQN